MDYGRFKFEALKKEKESRKEHNTINVKEMKLRPKISEHDFQTKFGSVRHFLHDGDKVKLTIMFRGREMVHQEYGRKLLDRMAEELKEVAIIERTPLVEGRNMIMIMSPLNKKHAKGDQHSNDRRPTEEVEMSVTVPPQESAEDPGRKSPAPNQGATTTMPKIRTHRGTAKRLRVTSTGKVMRRKAFRSHLLEHKSAKRKRQYRTQHEVSPSDRRKVIRLAPYL